MHTGQARTEEELDRLVSGHCLTYHILLGPVSQKVPGSSISLRCQLEFFPPGQFSESPLTKTIILVRQEKINK